MHSPRYFEGEVVGRASETIMSSNQLSADARSAAAGAAADERTITEACIYVLARALVIRQEHTDLREPGVTYNSIKYNPLGSADFVNPNFDVAYLEAWFAANDKTPVISRSRR